ncbi:hypothetical protein [Leucobacter luti]|uniref:hypothetical protein n=1 Tax=Leucobacter luti TaxID=340320 RepID=UPI003D013777
MIPFRTRCRSSPCPVAYERWPVAVQSAEALRGSLLRCGPGYRPLGCPETPEARAAALTQFLRSVGVREPLIAHARTAAWVWGACRGAPPRLQLATGTGVRARSPAFHECLEVRQLSFEPADLVRIGTLRVTGPLRTAADLLRSPAGFPRESRIACRMLTCALPGGTRQLTAELRQGPRHFRRLALARIGAAK